MVYVISKTGQPLMPTKDNRMVRLLLKAKKARVVRRTPFTIQLLVASHTYKQEITLGVDAGSVTIGISASTDKEELFAAELKPRNDVTKLMQTRLEFRRARRNRTTRYRAPRFNNRIRSKHKGWLAPSVEVKINNHLQGIRLAQKILPVTKIRIETAEFDLQALKAIAKGEPLPVGKDYQMGEMFGFYNLRQYVLYRDSYKCRVCGKSEGKLYVTNAEGKSTISPEDSYTICEHCAKLYAGKKLPFAKRRRWTHPTFMGIMRDTLMRRAKAEFKVPVEQTIGAVTKEVRESAGIDKSHVTDALCISEHPKAKRAAESFIIHPVRSHNRKIHKSTINKGGTRKLNQLPKFMFEYQLFDRVICNGEEGFVFSRRTSGSFDIRKLDGTKLSNGITYKKLIPLDRRKALLIEKAA